MERPVPEIVLGLSKSRKASSLNCLFDHFLFQNKSSIRD